MKKKPDGYPKKPLRNFDRDHIEGILLAIVLTLWAMWPMWSDKIG